MQGEIFALEYDKTFVARTSWVFGRLNTNNFVRTMLSLGEKLDSLTVVNDQKGSPTYSKDLANFLVTLSESEKYGIYHTSNNGYCSWYEFACKIFELANVNMNVIPVTTSEYYGTEGMIQKIKAQLIEININAAELTPELVAKIIAPRPMDSCLDKSDIEKNGFTPFRNWEEATEEYVLRLKLDNMERR